MIRTLVPVLRVLRAVAFAATVLAPTLAAAQQDPILERGFDPEKLYQVGDLDQVNLFNGNLSLVIPIGGTYAEDGALSYGLTLSYNAKLWEITHTTNFPGGNLVPRAELNAQDNAGIGWQLNLGRLFEPGDPQTQSAKWVYHSGDGGAHEFYPTLHEGEPVVTGTLYTRDGSYLRLTRITDSIYEVELPNGMIRRFTRTVTAGPFVLTEIRDRFGNSLSIAYLSNPVRWKLSDDYRTHWVYFKTIGQGGHQVVDKIELAAFGGTTATYTFGYSVQTIEEHCADQATSTPHLREVPLLTSIALPAGGGSYLMDQPGDYYSDCQAAGGMVDDQPGALHRLRLPTRGILEWTYQTYFYPARGLHPPGEPELEIASSMGVATRRRLDASGSCVGSCQWTYTRLHPSPSARTTRVTSPMGDVTDHHFNTTFNLSTSTWTGWEFGLPFTGAVTGGTGYYLSQEIYDGAAAPANKRRSIYVGYEHDKLPPSTTDSQPWYDTNRRVVREKTVYHDDGNREATVVSSGFDGLGHYRTRTLGGTFDAGNGRTETTSFNGALGTYQVNQATNQQIGSWGPWGATSPWVLETFDFRQVTENGQTSKEEYCFQGSTGYLLRKRILRAGTTRGADDLVYLYNADGSGNTFRERRFGGDLGTVDSGALCTLGVSGVQYRMDHTYQHGSLATSQLYFGNGTPLSFLSVDRTIDKNTGLPSSSRDPALVSTTYDYDALGRLTQASPAADARTTYTYHQAQGTSGARVVVKQIANGGPAVRAETEYHFDPFGRLAVEKRKQASGDWSKRTTFYNAMGWTTDVSEWEPDGAGHTAFTKYRDFDPFGRPARIEPPDGAAHEVAITYVGVRVVDRTVSVATGLNGAETASTTREIYDRQGRLFQVKEPSGAGGAEMTTTYGYDEGGRLSSVSQGASQSRSFTYDNRGFLTQECHPEKGAFGNGCVSYSLYDVWGNPGRTTDGPNDLRIFYDRAGRTTLIRENGGAQRPLKVWTYGTGTGAADRSNGKVQTAERYNYVLLGATPFTDLVAETYTYGGRGGRVSTRRTDNYINPGPGVLPSDSFTQGFVWNDLGDPQSLDYPYRLGLATGPTIGFSYNHGSLTEVPGYASSITYHSNGMLNEVAHTNGVTDTWVADPNRMQRPAAIEAWRSGTPLFLTGAYGYDGAGNVETIGSGYFVYDKVSRLTEGRVYTGAGGGGTQVRQTYSFDPYGNITSVTTNGVARNTPTSQSTNRLTSASYDAAGNVTGYNGATYQYGPFNDMWRYKNGSEEAIYLYTADGERLWEFNLTPGKEINRWTLRDLGGKVLREYSFDRAVGGTAGWKVEGDYVYRDGTLLAVQAPQGVRHFSVDHLGTPRLITNAAGNQVAYHVYYPFGEEATAFNQDSERMKFTGHERDLHSVAGAEDDLDYMHARYCSPVTGRFLSIDPAAQRRAHPKPQSWNRYAYGRGDPLNLIDPDGREVVPPTDRRTRKAVERLLSTRAGRAAYGTLERASGVYRFSVTRLRLTPVEQQRLRGGGTVTKAGGHFTPIYVVAEGRVQWQSGGTLNVDYGVVDRAADQPYAGSHGDAALLAHEVGHAADYEEDKEGFVGLSYDEQEESADELRDAVVVELEEQRREPRRRSRRPGPDSFSGTGFCSADNICH